METAKLSTVATSVDDLVIRLGSRDGLERREARRKLVAAGPRAVPFLIKALSNKKKQIRWEAAKALKDIGDPAAGPALVHSLMDDCSEVQWLAAEALIALGRQALTPLLEGLALHFDSLSLRQGAHHVLHDLERKQLLNKETLLVTEALRSLQPPVTIPWAAMHALDSLRKEKGKKTKALGSRVNEAG